MYVQRNLIQQVTLYEFKRGHNAADATKNICCAKDEGAVDHSTITRRLKKILSGLSRDLQHSILPLTWLDVQSEGPDPTNRLVVSSQAPL